MSEPVKVAFAQAELGWPAGRIRRAVAKLGAPSCPGKPLTVNVDSLRAWAAAETERLAIRPTGKSTATGWITTDGGGCWLDWLLQRAATEIGRAAFTAHECMDWDTARSRQEGAHYRVSVVRKRLLVRCGKCLEVRLAVALTRAWPVNLRVPETPK